MRWPGRTLVAVGALSALTSLSTIMLLLTRGPSIDDRELEELRAVTRTLRDQLKTTRQQRDEAATRLLSERQAPARRRQPQPQLQPPPQEPPQEPSGLRATEKQLQRELHLLRQQHDDLSHASNLPVRCCQPCTPPTSPYAT